MSEKTTGVKLVDIRNVSVDKNLPKHEKIVEFVRQIEDPWHYKCGKFTVTAKYSIDGPKIEDCIQWLMA